MTKPRAPRLSPDERRDHIKAATLPLLAQYGLDVRTKQIAEAAGIAEGTIFKVFDSLAELLDETIADALSTDSLVTEIDALETGGLETAETTISSIVKILHNGFQKRRDLIAMIPHPTHPTGQRACPARGHAKAQELLIESITKQLKHHENQLRIETNIAASALVAFTFAALHPMSAHYQLTAETITNLCCHGIVKC